MINIGHFFFDVTIKISNFERHKKHIYLNSNSI